MKYIKILLIVGLVALLFVFFLQNVDFAKVIKIISSVNWFYPIVFLAGLYIQFYVRAYRWTLLIKTHAQKTPIMSFYHYTTIGFFLSTLLPGKVGEPAKGILLANELKFSRSYGLASVVLERMIDMAMVVFLFMISLLFMKSDQSPLLNDLKTVSYFAMPIFLFFFLLFYLINTKHLFGHVERLIRFLARLVPARFRERLISFAINFVKGLRLDLGILDFFKLLAASLLVWVSLVPFYWILMQGFEFGAGIGIIESVSYFCIIVASAAIPTPGMAGSFDAASKHALLKLYGVGVNAAAAYTLLAHFLILITMLLPGFISFWLKGIHFQTIKDIKKQQKNKNKDNDVP